MYVKDGKFAYHYNWFDRERITIVSNEALQIGEVTVTMEFAYDGGGLGKGGEAVIGINGKEAGRAVLLTRWRAALASIHLASDPTPVLLLATIIRRHSGSQAKSST